MSHQNDHEYINIYQVKTINWLIINIPNVYIIVPDFIHLLPDGDISVEK